MGEVALGSGRYLRRLALPDLSSAPKSGSYSGAGWQSGAACRGAEKAWR